jgi:hypothetical protein
MQRKNGSKANPILPIALLLSALSAHAATAQALLYTLSGVTFNDGGRANGSFIHDANSTTFVSYDITTTDSLTDAFTGFHYTTANSSAYSALPFLFNFNAGSPNPRHLLGLDLSRAFGATPGTYTIQPGTLDADGDLSGNGELTASLARAIVSGSIVVTPAPEPSQTAAIGLGNLALTGLVLKARRRKATDA